MGAIRTKILKRSEHGVSRKNIDRDALFVMQHLNRSGYKAYLVGGSVRDLILGREPKDFDISTDAEPQQIKRLFRNCFLVGRRFRLAHIRFGRDKVIETSTFRRQPDARAEEGSLMQWDDNHFGTPIEDAFRRDFTINALFYDLHDFSVIDHVGGLSDLKRKVIRTIGDPNIRFREDPVLMVRAVRFAGRLDFKLEARTRRAILKHAPEILAASPARLLEELYKLFAMSAAAASFKSLWNLGLMKVLLPELDAYLKDSGGRKSPLWRMLDLWDQGKYWDGPHHPDLLLAVLFQGAILQACAKLPPAQCGGACVDWLEPVAARFRMPKGVRYRLLRLVENQVRMQDLAGSASTPRRRKAIARMLDHGSFSESLVLLQIRCAAGVVDEAVAAFWVEQQQQHAAQRPAAPQQADAEQEPPVQRPRRRRRRRRKPSHEA